MRSAGANERRPRSNTTELAEALVGTQFSFGATQPLLKSLTKFDEDPRGVKMNAQLNFTNARTKVVVLWLIAIVSISLSGYLLLAPSVAYEPECDVTCMCVLPDAETPSQDSGALNNLENPNEMSVESFNGHIQFIDWHDYAD